MFQRRAVKAAGSKDQYGLLGNFFNQGRQGFHRLAADQHQFFFKHFFLSQGGVLMKATDKRTIELVGLNGLDQLGRGAGLQGQLNLGIAFAVLGQNLGQTDGGRGLHGAQTQQTAGSAGVLQGGTAFFGQLQDAAGVGQKGMASRSQ